MFAFSQFQLWGKQVSRIPLLTLLSAILAKPTNLQKSTLSSQDFVQPGWKTWVRKTSLEHLYPPTWAEFSAENIYLKTQVKQICDLYKIALHISSLNHSFVQASEKGTWVIYLISISQRICNLNSDDGSIIYDKMKENSSSEETWMKRKF